MKILFIILLATLCTTVLSQSNTTTTDSSTAKDTTSTDSSSTTSIESTTVETTTVEISTTEATTTTEASTSTEPSKPTTTSKTTTSTTQQPVTTSSPVTVAPAPDKCSWNVTGADVTCIRAEIKAQFIIFNEDKKSYINLGCNATQTASNCLTSNVTQTLVLSETGQDTQYNLEMVFEKDSDKVFVRNMAFTYSLPDGEKGVGLKNDSDKLFNVKVGNSYLCRSDIKVNLGNVTMEISEIHIQAFGTKDKDNFGSAEECEADDKVSDVIPIAVGVALAALIIIVLIAYLVGRRRSRQRGYQSV